MRRKFRKYIFFAAVAALVFGSAPFFVHADEMASPNFKISNGSAAISGGASSSASYDVEGSAGEPAAGEGVTSPSFKLCEGYPCSLINAAAPPPPPPPGGGGGGGGPSIASVPFVYAISSPLVDQISTIGARASWQTNFLADSFVEYGTTIVYGSSAGNATMGDSHEVALTGLSPGTLYHLQMVSTAADGTIVRSADIQFTTLGADTTPPANPSGLSAAPGDGQVALSWQDPTDPDFAGVLLERNATAYPTVPGTGTKIYQGSGTAYLDAGLTNGVTYYYTLWSFDAVPNYSSGAVASGKPEKTPTPPVVPPVVPPVAPPANAPVVPPSPPTPPAPGAPGQPAPYSPSAVPNAAPAGAVEFPPDTLLLSINGVVAPIMNGAASSVAGVRSRVALPPELSEKTVADAYLRVGDSAYRLTPGANGVWSADFEMPSGSGAALGAVFIRYADKTTAYSSWTINNVVAAEVYENLNGNKVPVSGAVVTLLAAGAPWIPGMNGQKNPEVTGADGTYYFLAPAGDYAIKVEKTGYKTRTLEAASVGGVVSVEAGLVREIVPPPPPAATPVSLASLGNAVSNAAKFFKDKVIDSPQVRIADNAVIAPATTVATAAVVSSSVDFSFLLYYLYFIFLQPLALLDRRRAKTSGTVYNAFTKLPLDLALVRLVDGRTGRIVRTRVTDQSGRILFIAPPSEYVIRATRNGYAFPAPTMQNLSADPVYNQFYKGEKINPAGAPIAPNIPMEPAGAGLTAKEAMRSRSALVLKHLLASSTTIVCFAAFAITPNLWTGLNFAVQLAVLAAMERYVFKKRAKQVGQVLNAAGRPVRAVVRLFETTYDKLVETVVTDASGKFAFLVGPNKYYAVAEAPGIGSVKSDIFDFTKQTGEQIVAPELKIAPSAPPAAG